VNGILDTAVLVDILRAHPPALHWLEKQERLGIAPIVWLEIIEGAADAMAQKRTVQLLRRFERVDLLPEDFDSRDLGTRR
jgi:predicted nucleic acid-binding protein